MSKDRDRTVYRRGDEWVNKRNDSERALSVHQTQGEAEDAAREMLRSQGGGEVTTMLERDFEDLVKRLEPSEKLFRFAYALFERAWNFRRLGGENRKQALGNELRRIESDVARLIDRIVGSSAPTVAAALEKLVQELEEQKVLVAEQMANCGRPVRSF